MPAASAVRALPWARIFVIARIVLNRLEADITPGDRKRLAALLRKSKGDPRILTRAERADVLRIVRRVDVAKLRNEVAGTVVAGRLLRR